MAKDPTFPFYAQDYLVDTLRWDRSMKSLHVDLLCESWANGDKALVDDNGYVRFLSNEDKTVWDMIKHKWLLVNGFWVNEKIEKVRADRKFFKEQQSIKGKKSAEKRNNNPTVVEPLLNSGSTLESESEKEKINKKEEFPWKEVISYLNLKAKKGFREVNSNRDIILARSNEGYKLDDFKKIVDNKIEWLGDAEMDRFLRPETLFARIHFESYLNEKPKNLASVKSTSSIDDFQARRTQENY